MPLPPSLSTFAMEWRATVGYATVAIMRSLPRKSTAHGYGIVLLLAALLPLCGIGGADASAATPPPLRVSQVAVASDNAQASAAGVEILKAGGNAIDAACATALALGVLHPFASGIGGGGFALVYLAKEKRTFALDFRERAPAAVRADMFIKDGKVDPRLSREGGLAVGVPGEVRGLAELVRRAGKLSFARCISPAEKLALGSARVSWRLAELLDKDASEPGPAAPAAAAGAGAGAGAMDKPGGGTPGGRSPTAAPTAGSTAGSTAGGPGVSPNAETRPASPSRSWPAEKLFAPVSGGARVTKWKEGDRFRRPDLARTLGQLRISGPDAFYKGSIAGEIAGVVQEYGGVMTREDLERYQPTERTPIEVRYRGLRVLSMPPPSSGGVALAETLGILAARYPDPGSLPKLGRESSSYLHVLAEAMKHAFADRARHLGDPDFVKVPLEHLLSPSYHAELARRIKDEAIGAPSSYGTPGAPADLHRDSGTTHISVVDQDGNAVAMTTTVNLGFGAKLVAGKTGILLNDQMDDFSMQPGIPNGFGLIGSAQNAVMPNKRPLSSMTPTIVIDDQGVKIVAGAAGGPTIISATTQVLLNEIDWKMDAEAAIAAPRIHHQWFPEVLMVEPEILEARDVVDGLTRRGHKVKDIPHIGVANLIVRTKHGWEAAAEPRSPSTPAGY